MDEAADRSKGTGAGPPLPKPLNADAARLRGAAVAYVNGGRSPKANSLESGTVGERHISAPWPAHVCGGSPHGSWRRCSAPVFLLSALPLSDSDGRYQGPRRRARRWGCLFEARPSRRSQHADHGGRWHGDLALRRWHSSPLSWRLTDIRGKACLELRLHAADDDPPAGDGASPGWRCRSIEPPSQTLGLATALGSPSATLFALRGSLASRRTACAARLPGDQGRDLQRRPVRGRGRRACGASPCASFATSFCPFPLRGSSPGAAIAFVSGIGKLRYPGDTRHSRLDRDGMPTLIFSRFASFGSSTSAKSRCFRR